MPASAAAPAWVLAPSVPSRMPAAFATMEHQRQIIDTFVNSVYVFDDRVVLNFNFTDDAKTVTREEVLGSSAVDNAPPNKKNPNLFPIGEGFGFFVFFGYNNEGSCGRRKTPMPCHRP